LVELAVHVKPTTVGVLPAKLVGDDDVAAFWWIVGVITISLLDNHLMIILDFFSLGSGSPNLTGTNVFSYEERRKLFSPRPTMAMGR
jgi:hypothetical protein